MCVSHTCLKFMKYLIAIYIYYHHQHAQFSQCPHLSLNKFKPYASVFCFSFKKNTAFLYILLKTFKW